MVSAIDKLIISLFLVSCSSTTSKNDLVEDYITDYISSHRGKTRNINLLAISNEDCNNCFEPILKMSKNLVHTIISYDTNNYDQLFLDSKMLPENNDVLSRLNIGSFNGHRLYIIRKGKLSQVLNLTYLNMDSLEYYDKLGF